MAASFFFSCSVKNGWERFFDLKQTNRAAIPRENCLKLQATKV